MGTITKQWCPITGPLPKSDNRLSDKCAKIIEEARAFWSYPSINGWPEPRLNGIRQIVHSFCPHEILFSAQHQHGVVRMGGGWQYGENDAWPVIDVDEIEPCFLMETISNRAMLDYDFKAALSRDNDESYFNEENLIRPSMVFALLALSIAWNLTRHMKEGSISPKSKVALDTVHEAVQCLKRAQALDGELAEMDNSFLKFQAEQEALKKSERQATVTTATRRGLSEKADKRKDVVFKAFKSVYNGTGTARGIKMNTIANEVMSDIKEKDFAGRMSLNTVKKYLEILNDEGKITLPPKK